MDQYRLFLTDNIKDSNKSFYEPLKKNNLALLRSNRVDNSSKKNKVQTLKTDVELLSRMYISCQNRDGDLESFFEHENQSWPLFLADPNEIRLSNKADLLKPLKMNNNHTDDCP